MLATVKKKFLGTGFDEVFPLRNQKLFVLLAAAFAFSSRQKNRLVFQRMFSPVLYPWPPMQFRGPKVNLGEWVCSPGYFAINQVPSREEGER